MTHSFDVEFSNAIWAARDGKPGALTAWLQSDAPLGRGERDMLARYVSGELDRPVGNSRPKIPHPTMRDAAREYLHRVNAGEKGMHVERDICERIGIGRSKLLQAVKETKNRDARLERDEKAE